MEPYKFSLGQTVSTVGGVAGACIVARCMWETLQNPAPQPFYDVRLGDKTFSVSEAEIIDSTIA